MGKIYKINDAKAISETIDGETIIINLETGYYYSANKTATVIWNEIRKSSSVKDISRLLLNHYEVDTETAERCLAEIIGVFLKDDLISELDSDISRPAGEQQGNGTAREEFIIPRVERFGDMVGALTSDPVHDVNEDGWPNLRQ